MAKNDINKTLNFFILFEIKQVHIEIASHYYHFRHLLIVFYLSVFQILFRHHSVANNSSLELRFLILNLLLQDITIQWYLSLFRTLFSFVLKRFFHKETRISSAILPILMETNTA